MDSSLDGTAGNSLKRSIKMSVAEKRRLVYGLSKNSDLAFQALQEWTLQEIRQVFSAELGKERKYNSLTKAKTINIILKIVTEQKDLSPVEGNSESRKKIVSDENSGDQEDKKRDSPSSTKINSKRRRKNANPSRYVAPTSFTASGSTDLAKTKDKGTIYCKNLACRAILRSEDAFCKMCSCCICHKCDDNKDTSLWLTCSSDPPFASQSCGLSCHLDCASGLKEDKPSNDVDGCFYCVSCGKTNSLLECWKKQLLIAKETTKVDELCRRLVLAQKLLKGTEKYRKVSETVEEAVESLETEMRGPLTGLPLAMRKGHIDRLGSASEVKNLCSSALKLLEDTPLDDHASPSKMQGSTKIRFEDVHATSLTLIIDSEERPSAPRTVIHHSVWHRKVSEKNYQKNSTCALVSPNTRFVVSGLTPATEYCFKAISYIGSKESSVDETKVSTKALQEEEEEATFVSCLSTKDKEKQLALKETVPEKKSASCGFGLERCVKIIRKLECSGYVDKNFRQKFLTWYSLRATAQEMNVVKTFIDIFKDDSIALAEQLVDTFSDCISRKRSAIGGSGSGASALDPGMKPRH